MTPLSHPWYREPYVWLLIGIPLAAVIGGIVTLVLALQSDDGLVADDYYRQGLEINKVLDRDRAAERLGLKADIQWGGEDRQFRILLRGGDGFNAPRTLHVSFLHATRAGLDLELTLPSSGPAAYAGPSPRLTPGKWHVQIEADDWRMLKTLTIR